MNSTSIFRFPKATEGLSNAFNYNLKYRQLHFMKLTITQSILLESELLKSA